MSLRLFDTYVIDKVQNFIAAALSSRGYFKVHLVIALKLIFPKNFKDI